MGREGRSWPAGGARAGAGPAAESSRTCAPGEAGCRRAWRRGRGADAGGGRRARGPAAGGGGGINGENDIQRGAGETQRVCRGTGWRPVHEWNVLWGEGGAPGSLRLKGNRIRHDRRHHRPWTPRRPQEGRWGCWPEGGRATARPDARPDVCSRPRNEAGGKATATGRGRPSYSPRGLSSSSFEDDLIGRENGQDRCEFPAADCERACESP